MLDPFETIQKAADSVSAGDTVYVIAASSAYSPFTMEASGTASNKITFIGYNSTSTDLDDGEGTPDVYADIQNTGSDRGVPDSSLTDSPRISGSSRSSGNGIYNNGYDHIVLRNFWIDNVEMGVRYVGSADNCELENVYVFNTGDTSIYNGRGFLFDNCDDNDIINCVCYNTGQQGFNLLNTSTGNLIDDCRLYADDNSDAPGNKSCVHYEYLINDSNDNTIQYSLAYRLPDPIDDSDLVHGMHGFVIQAVLDDLEVAKNNTILGCEGWQLEEPFLLRNGGVEQNDILECTSEVFDTSDSGADGCFTISNGPTDNHIDQYRSIDSAVAIGIFGGGMDTSPTVAADANTFYNSIFENCEVAIWLSDYADERDPNGENLTGSGSSTAGSELDFKNHGFLHCTFTGTSANDDIFVWSAREAVNNDFINCIVVDFETYAEESDLTVNQSVTPFVDSGTGVLDGFTMDYCCFNDPGSTFPDKDDLGVSNIEDDPELTGADLELSSTSPCIDVGLNVNSLAPTDYDGDTRDSSPDIGAQEY